MAQAPCETIVLLGTGGTIAGLGGDLGYRAGTLPVEGLLARLGVEAGAVEAHTVARIDSADLAFADWRRLLDAVGVHLGRPEVRAIVVTHGTDTLEESAYLLQRVFAPDRPVVLVGAMRPADSAASDGPSNLADAFTVARTPGARGVLAVMAGRVWHGAEVRKTHPFRLDAFGAGEAGPVATVEAGRLNRYRDWPAGVPLGARVLPDDPADWPVVEIVTSHAGARPGGVDALVASGVHGLVVATTGNGTVHAALGPALARAARAGVAVRRASRCLDGGIVEADASASTFEAVDRLTPVQARIELMLEIAARRAAASRP